MQMICCFVCICKGLQVAGGGEICRHSAW